MTPVTIYAGEYAIDAVVSDDADLGGVFWAYDVDTEQRIKVNGWAVTTEDRDADERDDSVVFITE